jgi:threonine synthase
VPLPVEGLLAKAEHLNPSGSFKDRGAALMVLGAKLRGVARAVVDSSGNAGAAVAAYAARAGITCDVFAPAANASGKLAQIEAYGARVHRTPGPRAAAHEAALAHAETTGAPHLSHAHDPLWAHGIKTYLYELWLQMGGSLPDVLVIPAGHGTMVLGAALGLQDLLAGGAIERLPRLIAVQASHCAPIHDAFHGSEAERPATGEGEKGRPEGIEIASPPNLDRVVQALRWTRGDAVTVTNAHIHTAQRDLAAQGHLLEPTGAVGVAGWRVWRERGGGEAVSAVTLLCGSGLKTLSAAG